MDNHTTNNEVVEEWRAIPGFEGHYEASNLGRIRSVDRAITRSDGVVLNRRGKVLAPAPNTSGHLQVSIRSTDGIKRSRSVHQLVLEAFVGPKPSPKHEACHANDVKTDNRVENLRWDLHAANMQDILDNKLNYFKNQTHCKHGHEFTPDNIYWKPDKNGELTRRQCKTCTLEHSRKRYERHMATRRQ
ncbi:NUMOD4 domain-containing protein [Rhodococcus qingshengii]|uniref:NUMOD4 domain-containing protein n=1 Tax=Rhodococcus TaxID=1827 RepID=UPI001E59F5B8|nr:MULTISPECIES: NUMOD4 domain-containing protein [Rhodococcus]MCD2099528.1 NUMOD4 motif-containing HNH endonuclease [Rhodococcus rhodochrous]MCD2123896.1 NUMOD4 motif-containing HNH endonuclease [Rhodococcus rhodochrous]MCQ4136677.1 NUMOD4 motif-containing HNH endonuclease [Rhodococcus rhodochrous]MDJ0490662.1 NUMOD4 domain-containing protein [Rhodococcus qingshengii]